MRPAPNGKLRLSLSLDTILKSPPRCRHGLSIIRNLCKHRSLVGYVVEAPDCVNILVEQVRSPGSVIRSAQDPPRSERIATLLL